MGVGIVNSEFSSSDYFAAAVFIYPIGTWFEHAVAGKLPRWFYDQMPAARFVGNT